MCFLNSTKSRNVLVCILVGLITFSLGVLFLRISQPAIGKFRSFPSDPQIELQPSRKNAGRKCQPIYYGLGDGDGTRDPFCSEMQDRLLQAASDGDIDRIRLLIANGANAGASTGGYPLKAAAAKGRTQAAKILLDNGADVNHWHPIHGFPLLDAANSGNPEVVELLLSRGANVNLESDGYTALRIARERNFAEIVSLLEKGGAAR